MNGMAATSHPAATLTALDILRDGGNAVDAAIAAAAVLGVIEPHSTGIGGDCFVLYSPGGSGEVIALNGSGRAPAAATSDWYAERGIERIETQTPHAVTVPGAIAAWHRLATDHGRYGLDALLQPAINFAENGCPVHQVIATEWAANIGKLSVDPGTRRIYLPNGTAPAIGDVVKFPQLGATLRKIAAEGPKAFYEGPVAEDMVKHLRSLGGLHTLEDFATTEPEYVTPIRTSYRGYDLLECPPNGQGIIALLMLNILEGFDLGALDAVGIERLHLLAEATRLAFRDRDAYLADPAKARVPVEELLSPSYANALRSFIRPDKAMAELPPPVFPAHADTVYLTVVDRDRNAISFINSLYHSFGSGLVAPESGVLLQNRGECFSLDPEHPNCIAPSKRPMHTIIPGMLVKDDRAVMPMGVMGGHFQPVGQVNFLTNWLDHGMDIQEALDCPRAFSFDGTLKVENGVSDNVVEGLESLGHRTERATGALGGGQAIHIDWDRGILTGGSDPRKDGCALGY